MGVRVLTLTLAVVLGACDCGRSHVARDAGPGPDPPDAGACAASCTAPALVGRIERAPFGLGIRGLAGGARSGTALGLLTVRWAGDLFPEDPFTHSVYSLVTMDLESGEQRGGASDMRLAVGTLVAGAVVPSPGGFEGFVLADCTTDECALVRVSWTARGEIVEIESLAAVALASAPCDCGPSAGVGTSPAGVTVVSAGSAILRVASFGGSGEAARSEGPLPDDVATSGPLDVRVTGARTLVTGGGGASSPLPRLGFVALAASGSRTVETAAVPGSARDPAPVWLVRGDEGFLARYSADPLDSSRSVLGVLRLGEGTDLAPVFDVELPDGRPPSHLVGSAGDAPVAAWIHALADGTEGALLQLLPLGPPRACDLTTGAAAARLDAMPDPLAGGPLVVLPETHGAFVAVFGADLDTAVTVLHFAACGWR